MTAPNHTDNDPLGRAHAFFGDHHAASLAVRQRLSRRDGAGRRMSFVGGMFFYLLGAWPVIGFLGLDVALVYWAFRANYRAAAAFEEVTVTPSELRLRRVSHRGEVAEWTLNPLWTKLDRETQRGVRPAEAVSGVARPQASRSRASCRRRKRKALPQRYRGAGRGQARPDAGDRLGSEIGWDCRTRPRRWRAT